MTKSWNYLHLQCGNCGSSFTIENGPWGPYYACENPVCFNRFTAALYETLLDKVYDYVLIHKSAKGFSARISRSRLKVVAKLEKETPEQVTLSVVNLAQKAHHNSILGRM